MKMKLCSMVIDIKFVGSQPKDMPVVDPPPEKRVEQAELGTDLMDMVVNLATNMWRLKVRMVDPQTGEPHDVTRKLYRFVEAMERSLADADIEVIDKIGRPYDMGMPEKVVSFDQMPGLAREEIVETVRPSIRWRGRPLFHGEIIVAVPPQSTGTTDTTQPHDTEAASNLADVPSDDAQVPDPPAGSVCDPQDFDTTETPAEALTEQNLRSGSVQAAQPQSPQNAPAKQGDPEAAPDGNDSNHNGPTPG